ncbi:MAG TPA: DUF5808 domain-containing protein [Ktedonobacteraceae bacterium]|nr:DUF5808 domain-containing protein [Ktedonobacteraceae bacterium]
MSMSGLIFLLISGLLIVLVLVLLWHPQRSKKKANILADPQLAHQIYRDDDQYWYGGFFYNNPDDPALFVEKRYGIGWTLNFGHPQAKLVLIGSVVVVLVLSILPILFSGTASYGCHPSGCHPFP